MDLQMNMKVNSGIQQCYIMYVRCVTALTAVAGIL